MTAYIDEHRGRFGVEPICRVSGVSARAYDARRSGRRSARAIADEQVLARVRAVHAENYEAYGYRRTWKALCRAGERCGRRQLQRLMAAHHIVGATRRGRRQVTTVADPAAVRPADLVERDFTADGPGRLWVVGLHLRAQLGGRHLLQLRLGRVQPQGPSAGQPTTLRVEHRLVRFPRGVAP